MTEERITIDSNLDIQLHIHVFGFHPQGESILLIIFDASKEQVIRSIAVDCFIEKNKEQIKNTLKQYKISNQNPLNLIIWTHPDYDHSKGMGLLVAEFANKQTILVIPDGMNIWNLVNAHAL